MSQEKQGKKMSPAEKLLAGKDDKVPVPAKPTALSDEELDKVAGGGTALSPHIQSKQSFINPGSGNVTVL